MLAVPISDEKSILIVFFVPDIESIEMEYVEKDVTVEGIDGR
jgi:hypothetical protein